jgi:hypothetical protein
MYSSSEGSWSLIKHILCYLKGTTLYGLHITRISLNDFTDINWVSSVDNRKSTNNYLVYLDNTPISWKFGKQRTVTRSSTDVEYKALVDSTALRFYGFVLCSQIFFFFLLTPMTIFWCDNLSATYLFLPSIFLVVYLLNFTPNFIWSLHQLPEGVYYKKFYRNYRIISHICFYRISLCNTLYVCYCTQSCTYKYKRRAVISLV